MAVVPVEPVVATTAHGRRPAWMSTRMASSSAVTTSAQDASVGKKRTKSRPKPASRAAFSTELCAISEA